MPNAVCCRHATHVVIAMMFSLSLIATPAHAQQAPDAGTLLQQQPKPPAPPAVKPPVPAVDKPAAPVDQSGPLILVKSIQVRGNTQVPEAELVAQVRTLIGQQASLAQLQAAALTLVGYYSQKGYLARVFLPPQEIKDGVVIYQVVEGVRGAVSIEKKGDRIDTERVRRFVEARLPGGALMNIGALGEALNILNEQPGAQVQSALAPGAGEREIDVRITAADRPLFAANLGLNNQGARGTGELQMSAGLSLANPTGRFDTASLLLNASEGTNFVRADYSLAVGDRGLRIGANVSSLRYRLVQANFAALQGNGTADTTGLTASYPLARRTDLSLDLTGALDHKELVDRTVVGETGNRVLQVSNIGISGYRILPPEMSGGALTFGANLVFGVTHQRNQAALAADQGARRIEGGFAKIAWNAGLQRALEAGWTFSGNVRGQQPNKNLDSSERFSLGGPSGVRAYPLSEATGDAGWLMSLALNRRLGERFSVGGFIDTGEITQNESVPAGVTTPNRYGLSGAGLTANWQMGRQATLNLVYAVPVGNNPGKDLNGNNNDGSPAARPRAWISIAAQL